MKRKQLVAQKLRSNLLFPGKVSSIRLRNFFAAKSNMSKGVAVSRGKFNSTVTHCVAFAVFEETSCAKEAVANLRGFQLANRDYQTFIFEHRNNTTSGYYRDTFRPPTLFNMLFRRWRRYFWTSLWNFLTSSIFWNWFFVKPHFRVTKRRLKNKIIWYSICSKFVAFTEEPSYIGHFQSAS